MKNKYNLGDEVWRMCRNKPEKARITSIYISVDNHIEEYISYGFDYFVDTSTHQDFLFPTKEALIQSL